MADVKQVITFAADPMQPVAIYNTDIVGLYNRINRIIIELCASQSSNVSMTSSFDMTRIASYLDSLDRLHSWAKDQEPLDQPETSGVTYALELPPVVSDLENEDLTDLVRMFVGARRELVNSQSARQGSGLAVKQDSARLTAAIAKARRFHKDYMTPTQPLDLPASSPLDQHSMDPIRGV